jgi:PIN domain
MILVVIDTNILVSALLQPEGLPAAVFMLVLSGDVQLCISEAIFAEYDEVIRRPRLKRSVDVIEGTLRSIRRLGHWVKPTVRGGMHRSRRQRVSGVRSGCGGRLSSHWQSASFSRAMEEDAGC